jgi:hypothetical protein
VDNFRGVSAVKHGKGDTFIFWTDNWSLNGSLNPLSTRFPCLFSFVRNGMDSAAYVFAHEDITSLFHLPLSRVAFELCVTILCQIGTIPELIIGVSVIAPRSSINISMLTLWCLRFISGCGNPVAL